MRQYTPENKISQYELAIIYNSNRLTINRICRSHGVSPLKDKVNGAGWNLKDIDIDQIVRLYTEEDMTIKAIADKLNVNFTVINSRLRKSGIELKPKHLPKKHIKIPRYLTLLAEWKCKVMMRDEFICKWCKKEETMENKLQTHHIIPKRNIKDEKLLFDINNGITLCKECHDKIKWKEKQFEIFLRNLIQTTSSE